MREISAPAHFLLILRPGVTKLDFIAVADDDQSNLNHLEECQQALELAYENAFEEIQQQAPKCLTNLSDTRSLFGLCHQIVSAAQALAPHLNLDQQHVRAVAVRWLEQGSLPLGDAPALPAGAEGRWRSVTTRQAQLRFQDAIDWRAAYNCSLGEAKQANDGDRYEGYEEFGVIGGSTDSHTILKVPMSASRPNIVTLSNLKVFLAEHLLAYDNYTAHMHSSQVDGLIVDPGLTFFFLPIKGLGQYRAAIDWVGVEGYKSNSHTIQKRLEHQASTLQRLGLESLFTQSLIRTFSVSLQQAFFAEQEGSNHSSEALCQAFADLWWASEVRFFKAGHLHHRLVRAEGDEDTRWVSPTDVRLLPWSPVWVEYCGAHKGFLSTAGKGHPELTYIRLNLASFVNAANNANATVRRSLEVASLSSRDLESTIEKLSFDEVIFACHFFQPLPADLAEWVDQLGDSIARTLIEQTIQRDRIVKSRAKTLERAAHWVNGLVRSVGRAAAVEDLEAVIARMGNGHQSSAALKRVFESLQIMVLVEAGTGLLRLYGTLDRGDYGHLSGWFTETSKAEWKTQAAFQKYQKSVKHLVRAIACARGHTRVIVTVDGQETHYMDGCTLDLDELRFPPLSKEEKVNEPILTLLPALTEPLDNALNYLYKKRLLGTDYPLRLVIKDLRQESEPCIMVEIGNPFFEGDELPSTPGLAGANELLSVTKLASIGEGRKQNINGTSYYFVSVRLHPQRLAELIDKEG
jgi:hypothetical protein